MKRYIILYLLFFNVAIGYGQDSLSVLKTDSSTSSTQLQRPSILYQFVAGSAAYAIPFWALGGKTYIETGDQHLESIFAAILVSGATITFLGNTLCNCDGSYWAGIGGAFLGSIIAGPIYGGLLYDSKNIPLQYMALSLPPVIFSILLYQITLTDEDYETTGSSKQIYLSPLLDKDSYGLNLRIIF